MHPSLAQGIAAERRADLRRAADAYRRARNDSSSATGLSKPDAQPRAGRSSAPLSRRGRIRPVPGQRRPAAREQVASPATTDRARAGRADSGRTLAYRSAAEMLVLPDGTTESTEPTELCSAGR